MTASLVHGLESSKHPFHREDWLLVANVYEAQSAPAREEPVAEVRVHPGQEGGRKVLVRLAEVVEGEFVDPSWDWRREG